MSMIPRSCSRTGSSTFPSAADPRFDFGSNWRRFLSRVDRGTVAAAEESLVEMLGREALEGASFLDAGCGSGLFSLAARRLGARVTSFDLDPRCAACAEELRRRWLPPADSGWKILTGSVLDDDFMGGLGLFDVVYSWGVLHHTGDLRRAMAAAASRVAPGGLLFVAVYNDAGASSRRWLAVKRLYNRRPALRPVLLAGSFLRLWGRTMLADLLKGRPLASWRSYGGSRGMSPWRDLVDWVGGYPYEPARPEAVVEFLGGLGFEPLRVKPSPGLGCGEFVLRRGTRPSHPE